MQSFTLGPKLGRGPVGTSYGGRLADGTPIVVKVITRRFAQNPKLLEEIRKDLQSFVGFRQRSVSATLDVGPYEGRDVILYEPARGTTLEQMLKIRGRLDVQTALRIARDLSLGLAYAHERNLAIGDIRPSKVYFDDQHGAVLTDLGQFRASCLASGFGQHGLTFGHPDYLAPEVLQEGLYTPSAKSDVYALGILFFEMVNGRTPFQGTVVEVLHKHLDEPLPPPEHSTEVTPKLADWMLHMTAKRPANRIPDGKSVVNSLYGLLGRPAPFPDVPVMDSGMWAQRAAEQEKPSSWSESKVMKAPPSATSLLDELTTSGLLDQPDFSSDPLPEPVPVPEPAPVAEGQAEGQAQEDDSVQVRLGNKIGRGPVGTLYEGDLRGHQGQVAIKVITRRFNKHPELLEQLLDEIRRFERLDLNGLVQVRHVIRAGGRDLVVLDKAPGQSLRRVLESKRRLQPTEALDIVKGIALSLAAVHERVKRAHGDLRPEKVFIDGESVRVADYGFARASCLAANYGQFGMHFGHPTYLAPEVLQERKDRPDIASDMYALGILLYELVVGRPPFLGKDPKQTLLLHLNQKPPPPPRQLAVPTPMAELILRLMSKQPSVRPETHKGLLDALARCRKQMSLRTGLRQVVSVDEFDLADSGDESSNTEWAQQARITAERTGTWSRDKIGQSLGQPFAIDDLLTSEELPPSDNPFAS